MASLVLYDRKVSNPLIALGIVFDREEHKLSAFAVFAVCGPFCGLLEAFFLLLPD
jgi:hypothetical protein